MTNTNLKSKVNLASRVFWALVSGPSSVVIDPTLHQLALRYEMLWCTLNLVLINCCTVHAVAVQPTSIIQVVR